MQNKPKSISDYRSSIVQIPNIITVEDAERLKTFALNDSISGRHRRGSKNPSYVHASFYTCLIFPHNDIIYDILDPFWKEYYEHEQVDISFVEPYEIKSYVSGDSFGLHNDILLSYTEMTERKVNLIIQLSDEKDYTGGDLLIGSVPCSRKFGTGIFFPAKFLHSVTEVTEGERFSLIGHAWGPISK